MDPVRNPYSPGAGRRPPALTGRDDLLQAWDVALRRIELGRTAQPMALHGLRGVGKTVLLASFASSAEERGWIVARVEAGEHSSVREAIGEALHAPLARRVRPSAGRRLVRGLRTALSFKASYDPGGSWNFGLGLDDPSAAGATGVLETDLSALVEDLSGAAAEEGVGLAIVIDEAQELSTAEMAAVCGIAHVAGQQEWRFVLAVAGLPSLPRVMAEAKSYAERLFAYASVQQLEPQQARAALEGPSRAEGAAWSGAAVDAVVEVTRGYPYFLQQLGQETWNAADRSPIGLDDARVGVARGFAALDAGFFRSRWDRATRSEQRYLRAMALDGDAGSASGTIAQRLGRKPGSLGPARAALIAKGLVYPREHGVVAFTVPAMAAFIDRQPQA